MRRAAPLLVLFALAPVLMGHVGSPDVFFESQAGTYPVRIVVRPPEVVPGRAEITVRSTAAAGGGISGISGIAVQPVVWNAGPEGVPPAERAVPVGGDRSLWSAQLWLMRPTSYSVRVTVSGAAGKGTVLVPVVAMATRRLPMQRGMAIVLGALGAFLLAGALTAIGAAVRESELPPGEEPDPRHRRRARRVVAGTALLLALGLWGGRVWWRSVDADFARTIYRPFPVQANVREAGGGRQLTLKVANHVSGRGWTPLILDHGKLMHLFLVRQPGQDAFAHLHPVPQGKDAAAFAAPLPPLPAGSYRLYADVTHEDGFSETLTANVDVPPPGPAAGTPVTGAPPDPDDSFRIEPGNPRAAAGPGGTFALGDGLTLTWLGKTGPRVAGEDAGLRFALHGADGKPAPVEPYMGMLAHAAVVREDGQVFVHLHPEGTVSMAALQFFEGQQGKPMQMSSAAPGDGVLSFPWAFPRPGRYHLWVQVRSGGPVRTGVFMVDVTR